MQNPRESTKDCDRKAYEKKQPLAMGGGIKKATDSDNNSSYTGSNDFVDFEHEYSDYFDDIDELAIF